PSGWWCCSSARCRTRWPGNASMPKTIRTYVLVASIAATLACATNPATGQRQLSFISEEREIALGQENDTQIRKEMGSYDDRALQEYVTTVGMKLAMNSERPGL